MFAIHITDVIDNSGIKAISGLCDNLGEFDGTLRDNAGKEYTATRAISKDLIPGNPIEIFRIFDDFLDVETLRGETLTN